jgi:hypothetical protein
VSERKRVAWTHRLLGGIAALEGHMIPGSLILCIFIQSPRNLLIVTTILIIQPLTKTPLIGDGFGKTLGV